MSIRTRLVARIGLHRLLLFVSFFAFVSLGLPDGLLGVAWPSISLTFGRPLSRLAVLQIAMTAGFFISSTNAGRLIETVGVGRLLIGSNLLIATALAGYAFAPVWQLVVVSSVFLGMGGGAVDAGMNAYAAERFTKEEMNTLHAFYGVGAMLGPVIMRQILETPLPWPWGYRITLLILLILLALFIFSRSLWYADAPDHRLQQEAPLPESGTVARVVPLLGVLLFLLYTGLEVTLGGWTYSLLTRGRGVPSSAGALWVGAYWGALTLGRLFFGFFGGRWQARSIVTSMIVTCVVGGALFIQPWSGSLALLAMPLLGFACAPLFPLFVMLTPEVVGRAAAGRMIGNQVAAANVGAAVLPLMIGSAVEVFGLEAIAIALFLLTLSLGVAYPAWIRHSPIRHSRDSSPVE